MEEEDPKDPKADCTQQATSMDDRKPKKVQRQAAKMKSLTKPLLESVSESMDDRGPKGCLGPQEGPRTPTADEADEVDSGGPDCFGVKSYLHHFYEVISVKDPNLYEDLEGSRPSECPGDEDDLHYLFRSKKKRCRAFWWKATLWGSANLLAVGAIIMLVGYLVPRRPFVVGQQRDLEIIDRGALKFNRNLDACKVVGLVVFCLGGAALAASLLLPSFMCNYCDEEAAAASVAAPAQMARYTRRQWRRDKGQRATCTEAHSKVPVTEQVASVQPKCSDAE